MIWWFLSACARSGVQTDQILCYHKSMLGCVIIPLGRPRSVYKSGVESCFLESWFEMAKWPWRSRPMILYSISVKRISKCIFGANLVILAQIHFKLLHRNPNFLEFWVKWPKWPWRWRSMILIFNNSQEYHRMHVWCKFGNFSSNMWWVIVRTSRIS